MINSNIGHLSLTCQIQNMVVSADETEEFYGGGGGEQMTPSQRHVSTLNLQNLRIRFIGMTGRLTRFMFYRIIISNCTSSVR